jgi:glycosyltransferase involved in cell wall biosynthesis
MRILFLDQSGQLGGAELCLLDIAKFYQDSCCVALFADGAFATRLSEAAIPLRILNAEPLKMQKGSSLLQGLSNLDRLIPLIQQVIQLSRDYDVIYANTPKALIVGAVASLISHRPLAYHLHDIVNADHFSRINRTLLIALTNRVAKVVIANSQASHQAFIEAGGKTAKIPIVHNGFDPADYVVKSSVLEQLRQAWGWHDKFIVGHLSRLSPWKGQHILLSALKDCPDSVVAVFVGDALFGEQDYVAQIQQQVEDLGLRDRVKFLGFRSDIPALMSACDLVAHTSTAPEPFGRVIVEAMLCRKPVVAAAAGGAIELVKSGETGWLTEPGNVTALQSVIQQAQRSPDKTQAIAQAGYEYAIAHFQLRQTLKQIDAALQTICSSRPSAQLPVISRK